MALFTNSADNSEPAPRKVVKIAILGAGSWGTAFAKLWLIRREKIKRASGSPYWPQRQAMAECSQTREIVNIFRG